jgi:exodeoxyribonuclease-5
MTKVTLTKDQQNASDVFIDFLVDDSEKYMVLHGAAGSGKSYLIRHLLDTFQAQYKAYSILLSRNDPSHEFEINLSATTNKAVAVVKDFTGESGIKTVHSLLKLKVLNDFRTGKTTLQKTREFEILHNRLIIIDEASFIDDALFAILDESTVSCKILLVGDKYQLAPVGQTASIMDTLDCTKVNMHKILRNSGTIMNTAAQFRKTVKTGIFKPIQYTDDKLIHVTGPGFKNMVDDAYRSANYTVDSAKILAWTNAKVLAYNAHIRDVKGLPEQFQEGETVVTNNPITKGGIYFSVDSQVVITNVEGKKTIKGIAGREVVINHCYLSFLPDNPHEVKALLKKYAKAKNWYNYFDIKDNWLDLRSIYASSIHKSQGSTYERVFIDLTDIGQNWIASDVARLLYVAISRSSKQVICYGGLPNKFIGK